LNELQSPASTKKSCTIVTNNTPHPENQILVRFLSGTRFGGDFALHIPRGFHHSLALMNRRTFRQLRRAAGTEFHHHVYVVLLSSEARKNRTLLRENPGRDPAKPCVYVGMTGLQPKERFANHKEGVKAATVVQRYGLKLLPELYECFNPMPFEAAAQMERELAEDLRRQGYTVAGGT